MSNGTNDQTPKNSAAENLSRRSFIKQGAVGVAGIAAASASAQSSAIKHVFPASVLGANERIRTGHIGTGGMGMRNLQFCVFREQKDVQPIAVCDLREEAREQAADLVTNAYDRPTTHERPSPWA